MRVRHGFIVFAFALAAALAAAPGASAQKAAGAGKGQAPGAAAAPASETAAAEAETAPAETEAAEEIDADGGLEEADDGEAEPLELKPLGDKGSLDLDMSALGDMNPEKDLQKGGALADDGKGEQKGQQDWTERALELLEIHGYFRVRPEMYHKFYLRGDDALFGRPMESRIDGDTDPDYYLGEDCRDKDGGSRRSCDQETLAGANMRLRLEPTLNISEEVWVKTQLDFLDNVMLGSSPSDYQDYSAGSGSTIRTSTIEGFNVGPPSESMIVVRRAWGEVLTPIGQIRFGRMADHWGLGMLHNAGNGIDQDFGDSVDRLMFAVKINDWLLAPAFDFPNEGPSMTSAAGRPFDVSQLDDAYQLTAIVAYKHDEEEQRALLKRGDAVVNAGLHFQFRTQALSFEYVEPTETVDPDTGETTTTGNNRAGVEELESYHYFRRQMWTITPDVWFQLLYDTFHLELEAALIYGEVGNPDKDLSDFDQASQLTLVQWGGVLQADYGLLSDQLRIGIEFGFASGDPDVEGLNSPTTFDQANGPGSGRYTAFAFNPGFSNDFIMYHHLLGAVSQSYYFRPWLGYDFLRSSLGKKLGIRFDIIYSRAVYADSTISNSSANLGVELNGQVMYVSADNFHAGLKYGVLFPLGGYKGAITTTNADGEEYTYNDQDLTIPQTLQVLLGISF